MPYLLVDTSYTIFFRYYATHTWYRFAHKDDKFEDDYDWIDNKIFKEKFADKYFESFEKIIKKYKIPYENIIFIRDCPRESIWRTEMFEPYKANRDELYVTTGSKPFKGGPFFKYTYETIIPDLITNLGCKTIKEDFLEADDIISLTKKYLREKYPEEDIIIVGSDCDLLQILDKKTTLIDLKNKVLNTKSCGNPEIDLELKVMCGDKSDNIPPFFPKCGEKTALKLIENRSLLGDKFKKDPNLITTYARNKILVDLNCIPEQLKITCNNKIKNLNL